MNDLNKFDALLEDIYENGGSPEYLVVPGLGEFYWPGLIPEERAFVQGWLLGSKYEREKT